MNPTFDMRLDIKPSTQRSKKPAVNQAEKPASDSSFQKTMENAKSAKQSEAQKPSTSRKAEEAAVDTSAIPQEDTVDLQNVAAMMAAIMMPAIVMPEQMQVQPESGEQASQILSVDVFTAAVSTDMTQQETVQQSAVLQEMKPTAEQSAVEHTAAEPEVHAVQKVTEDQKTIVQENQISDAVTEAGAAAQSARPLFGQVDAAPIQVAEPVPADTPEFPAQLAKQVNTAVAEGNNTVEVQLTPYELGKITIRLTVTEEGTQISMHSANSRTVRLLSEHAANIGAIVEQNQHGTVSVSVEQEQPNAQQQNQYAQQEQQKNGQQQQQHQGNRHAQMQNEDFIQQLRLGLAGLS